MGILYSITSFFYPSSNNVLTEAKIKTKSQKLIIRIRNLQYKLQQDVFRAERQLLSQIHQQPVIRSRQGEKVRMNMIIENSQTRLVYDEVIYCLNKIIGEANVLQISPSHISNECYLSICSIIYVYSPLQLQEFINLNQFIPEPFPSIGISKIRPLLQRYLKKQSINDYERNLYAIQFAKRNNQTLENINIAGHHFVSNPVEPNEVTPSAQMFAITLQEMNVEEQINA